MSWFWWYMGFVVPLILCCNFTFPAGNASLVHFFDCDPWTLISSCSAAHGSSMPNQWANDHSLGLRPTRHPGEMSRLQSPCVGAECKDTATSSTDTHWGCKFNFKWFFPSLTSRAEIQWLKKMKTKCYIQLDHFNYVTLCFSWGIDLHGNTANG